MMIILNEININFQFSSWSPAGNPFVTLISPKGKMKFLPKPDISSSEAGEPQ